MSPSIRQLTSRLVAFFLFLAPLHLPAQHLNTSSSLRTSLQDELSLSDVVIPAPVVYQAAPSWASAAGSHLRPLATAQTSLIQQQLRSDLGWGAAHPSSLRPATSVTSSDIPGFASPTPSLVHSVLSIEMSIARGVDLLVLVGTWHELDRVLRALAQPAPVLPKHVPPSAPPPPTDDERQFQGILRSSKFAIADMRFPRTCPHEQLFTSGAWVPRDRSWQSGWSSRSPPGVDCGIPPTVFMPCPMRVQGGRRPSSAASGFWRYKMVLKFNGFLARPVVR